jgi:hypothetical protein
VVNLAAWARPRRWLKPTYDKHVFTGPIALILEKIPKGSPPSIRNRFSESAIFQHVSYGQIFDGEGVALVIGDKPGRSFLQKVFAPIGDFLVDQRNPAALFIPILAAFYPAR